MWVLHFLKDSERTRTKYISRYLIYSIDNFSINNLKTQTTLKYIQSPMRDEPK